MSQYKLIYLWVTCFCSYATKEMNYDFSVKWKLAFILTLFCVCLFVNLFYFPMKLYDFSYEKILIFSWYSVLPLICLCRSKYNEAFSLHHITCKSYTNNWSAYYFTTMRIFLLYFCVLARVKVNRKNIFRV